MTTNDIDAIRKLTDAATPGPWRAHTSYPHTVWQGPEDEDDPGIISTTLSHEVVADAEFIAAARTLVPALCDEIEQLRAQLAATEPEELTEEPGPEVTQVIDDEGDLWIRSPEGWRCRSSNGYGDPWKWAGIAAAYGPMRAVES